MDNGLLIAYLEECAETEKEWYDIKLRKQEWRDANIFNLRRNIVKELLKLVEQQSNIEQSDLETRITLLEKELEIRQLKLELEIEKNNIKEKIVYLPKYPDVYTYPHNPWWTGPYYTTCGTDSSAVTWDAKGATGSGTVTSPVAETTSGTRKV